MPTSLQIVIPAHEPLYVLLTYHNPNTHSKREIIRIENPSYANFMRWWEEYCHENMIQEAAPQIDKFRAAGVIPKGSE